MAPANELTIWTLQTNLSAQELIIDFLDFSTNSFFNEVVKFMSLNDDPTVLGYSTEATLLGLYMTGMIRMNNRVTVLQEYKVDKLNGGNGRVDLFVNYLNNAIWIEAKWDDTFNLFPNHWDLEGWMKWDKEKIFSQLEEYYNAEKINLENKQLYKSHYLVTMVFKILNNKTDFRVHNQNSLALKDHSGLSNGRDWYYRLGYLEKQSGSDMKFGIEVYGSVTRVK